MNVERLNINVNGTLSVGFDGDESLLLRLESIAGGKLPSDYITFLKQVNGGHPEVGSFYPLGNDRENNIFDVDWFYSVDNPNVKTLEDAFSAWGNIIGRSCLPIGRDGGDNQIYLSLDHTTSSVWLYLHDENCKKIKLADSFTQFIDGLIQNPDFI